MDFQPFVDPNIVYDDSNFVDRTQVSDFVCLLCLHVPFEPVTHGELHGVFGPRANQPPCSAVFCDGCFNKYVTVFNADWVNFLTCPQNCGRSMTTRHGFPDIRRIDRERQDVLDNLLVNCSYEDCDETLAFSRLRNHQSSCNYNPRIWCSNCRTRKNNDHECRQFVQNLKDEIAQLKAMLSRQGPGPSEASSTPATAKVKAISNSVQVLHTYGSGADITVRFGERTKTYHRVALDYSGRDLRSRIERDFGCQVGQIIHIKHRELTNNMLVRQADIKHRPTYLVALPKDMTVTLGQTLNINIEGPGPVI